LLQFFAEKKPLNWEAAKTRFETLGKSNLSDEEQCQTKFDILWTFSKAGNYEARYGLMFYLWGFMHTDFNYMPGHDDIITHERDRFIIAVHTVGMPISGDAILNSYLSMALNSKILFDGDDVKKKKNEFWNCYLEKQSKECVEQAVKNNLVPSFDVYAAEIDGLIAAGYKPVCNYYHRDHWRKKREWLEEDRMFKKAD
jgi:hypothetical protein